CLRWAGMDMLNHLLNADAAAPRLTVYNESTGARMDFSAQTLENWVARIANTLEEELELDDDSALLIDLPVACQAAVIALDALAVGTERDCANASLADDDAEAASPRRADAVVTSRHLFHLRVVRDAAPAFDGPAPDVGFVTDDPFGRGGVEAGGEL